MKELIKEYNLICDKLEILALEFMDLKENEYINKYFKLIYEIRKLDNKRLELYKEIKELEYKSCNHIWVYIDSFDDSNKKMCGCIKCGLNEIVKYYDEKGYQLNFKNQIMNDIFNHIKLKKGIYTNISCDLNLALAITNKIKKNNPNIDDMRLKKYFEIALDNIRNIEVSEERKRNRAKRLGLNYDFDKWS